MKTLDELKALIASDLQLKELCAWVERKTREQPSPDQGHDIHHFLRVALWTVKLGGNKLDPREAIAAALLHDIVQIEKNSPLRREASRLCAEEAERVLPRYGFTPEQTTRIRDAVRCHSFSRGELPATDLGKALQDADRLEALGAIGIFRLVSTGARMGSAYFHPADPWAKSRELDDKAYSTDHFFTKLLKLPDSMLTPEGRAEASSRARVMRDFVQSLGQELGNKLTDV
jgi:uncharacterized protein